MWKLEVYREKYCARKGSGANTVRRSLRTADVDVAKQRFRQFIEHQRPKELIKDMYATYAAEKENSHNRLDYIWRKLGPFFGHLTDSDVTRKLCKEYASSRNVKGSTIARELGALRAAIRFCKPATKAQFWMPKSSPPKDRYLTKDEARKLLEGAIEPHVKLFITLAIGTAARKSAICNLTWEQVDFERGRINYGASVGNKGKAITPINKSVEAALEEAYKGRLTDNVIEFRGKPVKNIRRGIEAAAKRAGLEGVSAHVLRHTAAVWMAEARVPMSEIAQYLGHSSTSVTEKVYARYSPEYLKSAASALELSSVEPEERTL